MLHIDIGNKLNVCFDKDEHKKIYDDFVGGYGFNKYTMAAIDAEAPAEINKKNFQLISTYPEEWVDRYINNSFFHYDAVVESLKAEPTMVSWEDSLDRSSYKDEAQKIFSEAAEYGLKYGGIGMSFVSASGQRFGVGMAGSESGVLDFHDPKTRDIFTAIYYITEKFFVQHRERFYRDAAGLNHLTDRQHECLTMLANPFQYKTEEDIAQALGISVNGVKKLNRHIYAKLSVENRIQAVCKAQELNLI